MTGRWEGGQQQPVSFPLVSVKIYWTFHGGGRVTPPHPDAILLNAGREPALSVCLSVCSTVCLCVCVCLVNWLSICTKCQHHYIPSDFALTTDNPHDFFISDSVYMHLRIQCWNHSGDCFVCHSVVRLKYKQTVAGIILLNGAYKCHLFDRAAKHPRVSDTVFTKETLYSHSRVVHVNIAWNRAKVLLSAR